METKSAKALNNYFISSIELYKNIKPKTNLKEIKSDIKNKYQESEFEQHYQNFLSEIRLNSREYKDMWVILEYTSSNLSDVRKWNKYETIPQKVILETGFEVNFLIKLKLNLDKYHHLIEMTCSSESYGSTAMSLRNIFNHEMEVMREETKALRKAQNAPKEAPIIKPAIDDRFDYDKMMAIGYLILNNGSLNSMKKNLGQNYSIQKSANTNIRESITHNLSNFAVLN